MTRTQFPNPVGCCLPHEHNTCESTRQAQIRLDSSTEGAVVLCSSSSREDAGASCSSSHRQDSMSHPSYGFIPLPIPVGAVMPYHYGAILQPVYDPQDPRMHCDSAVINKAAIWHASGQSNYNENRIIPSQLMNTNSRRKNNSCIIQDKFLENQVNQLTW